jgi:hypothetical protein
MVKLTPMLVAVAVIARIALGVAIAADPTEPKLDSAEVTHITRLVDAAHPGCTIYHLTPFGGETVYIATTCEVFKAVKKDGRWHLVPADDVIVTH